MPLVGSKTASRCVPYELMNSSDKGATFTP